jgi:hypothetical protein
VNVVNFKVKNRKGKNEEKKNKKKSLLEVKEIQENFILE